MTHTSTSAATVGRADVPRDPRGGRGRRPAQQRARQRDRTSSELWRINRMVVMWRSVGQQTGTNQNFECVQGGAKSGHPAATDQGPRTLIM